MTNVAFSSSDEVANDAIDWARVRLKVAYNETVFADQIGTNVDGAVEKLNQALEYINKAENLSAQGNFEQAQALAQISIQLSEEVRIEVNELKIQKGLENWYTTVVLPIVAAVVLSGVGIFFILLGLRSWKRRQEKKLVEMRENTSNEPSTNRGRETDSFRDADEEKMILVVFLSTIIIIAGLIVYVSLTPAQQEYFASIYVLNSEKKTAYPELLVLGKNNTFLLWVGVENSMNRIEYANVTIGIANSSSSLEQQQVSAFSFERILLNKETWEIPVTMTLNKTGQYRIDFELWLYNEMKAVFEPGSSSNLQMEVVAGT